MSARRHPYSILVPILDRDITAATLAAARSALGRSVARVVLLHVVRPEAGEAGGAPAGDGPGATGVPRWRALADAAPAGCVFADAVMGEPADVILSQAERFRSDLIVLGDPARTPAQSAWVREVIGEVRRAAPGRVRVAAERAPRVVRRRGRRPPSRQSASDSTTRTPGGAAIAPSSSAAATRSGSTTR